jgi:hypothetical protein
VCIHQAKHTLVTQLTAWQHTQHFMLMIAGNNVCWGIQWMHQWSDILIIIFINNLHELHQWLQAVLQAPLLYSVIILSSKYNALGGTRWCSGWGTVLLTGRSQDRFTMSLEFFIDIILAVALWPRAWLSL